MSSFTVIMSQDKCQHGNVKSTSSDISIAIHYCYTLSTSGSHLTLQHGNTWHKRTHVCVQYEAMNTAHI
jgi:hypothetical protein